MYSLFNFLADYALRYSKIVVPLQSNPNFGRYPEVLTQPKCGVCRNRPPPVDDGTNATWRDCDISGKPVDADAEWLHEIFEQNFARMNWVKELLLSGHNAPQW
jgi:hypothetical protein